MQAQGKAQRPTEGSLNVPNDGRTRVPAYRRTRHLKQQSVFQVRIAPMRRSKREMPSTLSVCETKQEKEKT